MPDGWPNSNRVSGMTTAEIVDQQAASQETVVVGVDGSDDALGAARWAADFAAA